MYKGLLGWPLPKLAEKSKGPVELSPADRERSNSEALEGEGRGMNGVPLAARWRDPRGGTARHSQRCKKGQRPHPSRRGRPPIDSAPPLPSVLFFYLKEGAGRECEFRRRLIGRYSPRLAENRPSSVDFFVRDACELRFSGCLIGRDSGKTLLKIDGDHPILRVAVRPRVGSMHELDRVDSPRSAEPVGACPGRAWSDTEGPRVSR